MTTTAGNDLDAIPQTDRRCRDEEAQLTAALIVGPPTVIDGAPRVGRATATVAFGATVALGATVAVGPGHGAMITAEPMHVLPARPNPSASPSPSFPRMSLPAPSMRQHVTS